MTQPDSSPPVQQAGKTSLLLSVLGGLFIACFFLFFTWRVLLLYYSGDDMMNLYIYWSKPVSALVKGNLLFWTPFYRPFGGIIYRTFFAIFGFNPRPVYLLYYVAMLVNLWLAYLVLTKVSGSREVAAIATLLYCFHGKFDYLYYNAGSMYDVFCFLFSFLALLIYFGARFEGPALGSVGNARVPGVLRVRAEFQGNGRHAADHDLDLRADLPSSRFPRPARPHRMVFSRRTDGAAGRACGVDLSAGQTWGRGGLAARHRIYSALYLGTLAAGHRDVSGDIWFIATIRR